MEVPKFITNELFQRALRTYYNNNNIEILECKTQWAVAPGDHFTSDLMRCSITYRIDKKDTNNTISVLVKSIPGSQGALLNTIKDMKLFEKEIQTYTKLLPIMDSILGNFESLSPKCLYAEEYPIPFMIIEDLTPLGYKMLDRREGLDLDHCIMVMKKISELHAASMVMYEKDPTVFLNYHVSMFSGHAFVATWIDLAIDCIIDASVAHPGMDHYISKLNRLKDTLSDQCIKSVELKSGTLNVFNHGDCWNNNLMFLYDVDGKPTDVKLVDHQLGVYSGPAVDLQYFWSTTPNLSVRQEHLNTIIDYYYDHLLSTLIRVNYPQTKLPSRQDVYKDFQRKVFYGFAGSITTLPLTKCDPREDATLMEVLKPLEKYEGSFREYLYTHSRFWKHFEHVLPFYDKLGLFD